MSARMITKKVFMEKYGATLGTLNRAIHDYQVKKVRRLLKPNDAPGENLYREGELLLAVMNTWKESRDLHLKRAQAWQALITNGKQKYMVTKNREDEEDVDTNCVREAAAGGRG